MTLENSDRDETYEDLDAEQLGGDGAAEVAEIRADIEETRLEMGGTLNELGDRLEPSHLVEQAKENVREATIGRVEETAKGVSDMVMETIKRNPIPAAITGAGLALLWKNRAGGSQNGDRYASRYPNYSYDYAAGGQYLPAGESGQSGPGITDRVSGVASSAASTVGDTVGQVGGTVGQTVGQVGQGAGQVTGEVIERGRQTVQDLGWRLDRFMQASPLAMVAIAAGAGAVFGALVPETEKERQVLGEASHQVGTAVRDTVDQATQKAEQSMDEAEQSLSSSPA